MLFSYKEKEKGRLRSSWNLEFRGVIVAILVYSENQSASIFLVTFMYTFVFLPPTLTPFNPWEMFLYETQLRVWPQAMTLLRDIQNCIASAMWFFLRVDTGRWTVEEKPGHRCLLGRWQRTSRERYGRVGLHHISRGWHGDSLFVAMETDEPITLRSLGLNMGFKGLDRLRTPDFCALPWAVLACGRS